MCIRCVSGAAEAYLETNIPGIYVHEVNGVRESCLRCGRETTYVNKGEGMLSVHRCESAPPVRPREVRRIGRRKRRQRTEGERLAEGFAMLALVGDA